jgi:hypothetical protein
MELEFSAAVTRLVTPILGQTGASKSPDFIGGRTRSDINQ